MGGGLQTLQGIFPWGPESGPGVSCPGLSVARRGGGGGGGQSIRAVILSLTSAVRPGTQRTQSDLILSETLSEPDHSLHRNSALPVHICAYLCVCLFVCLHGYMQECVCVFICIYCMCMLVRAHVCVRACTRFPYTTPHAEDDSCLSSRLP